MGIEDGGSQFSRDDLVESYMAADEKPNQALVLREVTEPAVATPAQSLAAHPGIGSQRFTQEQQTIIERIPEDDDIDILPTGEIYYGQVQYRRRLNEAFGPGGWGLIPVGPFYQDGGETLCREYALVCEGRIVSTAIGETDFQPNNARFSKATAAESVKSIALRRTAKDIGIADDCWDKRFIKRWLDKNAIRVWTVGVGSQNKGQKKPMWRRKDAEPFEFPWKEENAAAKKQAKAPEPGEQEPVLDPNQKWKDWAASAMKQDRSAFIEMLGAHGFETPAEVTNRDMQKAIFKEWNGKGTEEA